MESRVNHILLSVCDNSARVRNPHAHRVIREDGGEPRPHDGDDELRGLGGVEAKPAVVALLVFIRRDIERLAACHKHKLQQLRAGLVIRLADDRVLEHGVRGAPGRVHPDARTHEEAEDAAHQGFSERHRLVLGSSARHHALPEHRLHQPVLALPLEQHGEEAGEHAAAVEHDGPLLHRHSSLDTSRLVDPPHASTRQPRHVDWLILDHLADGIRRDRRHGQDGVDQAGPELVLGHVLLRHLGEGAHHRRAELRSFATHGSDTV
mmetsp:Transcript_25419/g.49647  ORF Transcript_25419/g.49647 Transcript_25419/m.49647 type:complete len:264 (+) Transcript_25419:945-1736(+)